MLWWFFGRSSQAGKPWLGHLTGTTMHELLLYIRDCCLPWLGSLASSGAGSKLLPSSGMFKVLWSPIVITRGRQILRLNMWRMLTSQTPCLLSQIFPSLWLSWQCLLGRKARPVCPGRCHVSVEGGLSGQKTVMPLIQHCVHHCLCYYCFTFVFVRTAYWWLRVKTLSFSALLSFRKRKKATFLLGKHRITLEQVLVLCSYMIKSRQIRAWCINCLRVRWVSSCQISDYRRWHSFYSHNRCETGMEM